MGVFTTWLLCALITVGFTVAVSLNAHWLERRRVRRAGGCVSQFGFHGRAAAGGHHGRGIGRAGDLTMVIDMVVTASLCIALSRLDGADEHGAVKAFKKALRGVLANPMPWAIFLGALVSVLGWQPPQPVAQTIGLLADAASPVALFKLFLHPLLAERFGADNGRIARIILVSTAAAFVTFSLTVSLMV